MAPTVSEMESVIRSRLNEPSQARITSAEILKALNDGGKDVASLVSCVETEVAVTTVAGNRLVPFSGARVIFVKRDPRTFGYNGLYLCGGTYGDGLYCVVSPYADVIYTSSNLHNWFTQENWDERELPDPPDDADLYSIAWNEGAFCAVGFPYNNASYHGYVITSPNGEEWTRQYLSGTLRGFVGIISGNGIFCAVGNHYNPTTGLYAATSTEGVTWTDRTHANPLNMGLVAVGYGNGIFCAVGTDDPEHFTNGYIEWSDDDGENWTASSIPGGIAGVLAILWLDSFFLAVTYGGEILTSPDGKTWTLNTTIPAAVTFGIAYNGSDILVFALNPSPIIIKSTDMGGSWTTYPPEEFLSLLQLFEPPIGGEKALLKIRPEMCGFVTTEDSTPKGWFPWGDKIVVEPVPDDVYYLKLFIADYPASEMTLVTDSPDSLPDEFQPCIMDYACYVLSMKLKKWRQAAIYYNTYIHNLKKRRDEYIQRKAEKSAIHKIPDNVKYEGGQPWAH
jgi:hypothetical protein